MLQPDGGTFMPHGMCYLWEPDLLWLHVVSDVATGVAYWAIPPTLFFLVVRARGLVPEGADYERKRLPHEWMFLMFGLFIVACGTTHLLAAWNVWNADYWVSGGVKALTATVSLATAVALPPLIPRALDLVRDARQSELRREQLEEANRELAALNEQLQQVHAQQTRFFANISHELRTPLTLILGPVEERLGQVEDPELRTDLELVRSNGRLLERRVQDLLDLARSQSGEQSPHYTDLDLVDVISHTRARFARAAQERDVRFDVVAPESLPIHSDARKVERVVDNLVTNAFKFAPAGGRIEIRARTAAAEQEGVERWAVLEVADSGPGVPPEHHENIFDRFRQLGGAGVDGSTGSGLGLAIVQDFVHLLGGEVGVEEDPELGGALFTVRIPVRSTDMGKVPDAAEVDDAASPEIAEDPADPVAPSSGEPVEEAPLGNRPEGAYDPTADLAPPSDSGAPAAATYSEMGPARVLIVEDVGAMRQFLDRTLATQHEVRSVESGERALALLGEWQPDLVVTDLMMPGMDGETLVRRIRSREELADVPVLVLSARADDAMRTRLLRGGAQDYVTKPFSADEIRARVRNLVSMKRVRDLLRADLEGATGDVEALAFELRRHHEELEQALREVRTARDEAEAASRAKSEFLAVMSHELRTPLNAIIGYAQLLKDGVPGDVTPAQVQHLDRIRAGASQLVAVIDDILDYSREGSRPRPVSRDSIRLRELVGAVTDGLVPQADAKGVALVNEVPDELELQTDRERLRRILTNLTSNAVKFTAEGSVTIDARERADTVEVEVRDTGIGIAEEDRERIFDPFWQVDQSSTRTQGGTGLGLSIVKRLVDQLGGTIELETRPGEGSTFAVRLPKQAATNETETEGQRKFT